MKVVTSEQIQGIDRVTIQQRGIPAAALMDRAGRAIAREALDRFEPQSVAIVAGKGNNAGDGFIAARELTVHGVAVTCFFLFPPEEFSPEALAAFQKLPDSVIRIDRPSAADLRERLFQFDLVIDAILGSGLHGAVQPPLDAAIEAINASQVNVLSVDVPSGLPGEPLGGAPLGPCVRATVTVAIGLPKAAMVVDPGVRFTGTVVVQDIGFPPDLLCDPAITLNLLGFDEARALLPPRPPNGHKGTFGKVMILAGSEGMAGAAILAARAAARSGAGLVYCAYPQPLGPVIEAHLIEPVKLPLGGSAPWFTSDHIDRVVKAARDMDAVAIGPGLGRNSETRLFLQAMIKAIEAPLVIDADGLRLLAENLDDLRDRPGPTVLTPHPAEAADLLGCTLAEIDADRLGAFQSLCSTYGIVVALKGSHTVTTAPDGQRTINPSGNTGLAKGGSGDVLTGLIAGLLAQGSPPADATRLGVFLHGLAADIAAEKTSVRAMTPEDVLKHFGEAYLRLERGE